MRSNVLIAAACLFLLPLTSGCYTTFSVNFGNGTATPVQVQSSHTQKQVEVGPARFKKMPHGIGDLLVTTQTSGMLKFQDVTAAHVDNKYLAKQKNIFGPGSVTLNVMLETNMQLYVVMSGKTTVDGELEQPKGYPKVGQRLNE